MFLSALRHRLAAAHWRNFKPPRIRVNYLSTGSDTPASSNQEPLRVAVIGSGPGGFYTTKYLLSSVPDSTVDLYDRLPTPFGLVRSGVAPDHQDVKAVQSDFENVALEAKHRFNFYGNINVGEDVTLSDLQSRYHAVVMCYGAGSDRSLGIPGEHLEGVHSARSVVNWYNSHPNYASYNVNLSKSKTCVVIGQGNVAVDCARILTASTKEHLASTDISDYALDALNSSSIERVIVLGRRGHVQSAFTNKELRELTKLKGVNFVVSQDSLEEGMTPSSEVELKERVAKRKNKLLVSEASKSINDDEGNKIIELQFLRGPVEFLPSENDPSRVGAVRVSVNRLDGPPGKQQAVDTGERLDIECELVLKSVGYKVEPLPGVPYDVDTSTVSTGGASSQGRVIDLDSGVPVPGLYCAGWAKRGPTGVVATNIPCARETVASIKEDFESGRLPEIMDPSYPLGDAVVVDWDGYLSIDAHEVSEGEKKGKVRDKLFRVDDMLKKADVFGMRMT